MNSPYWNFRLAYRWIDRCGVASDEAHSGTGSLGQGGSRRPARGRQSQSCQRSQTRRDQEEQEQTSRRGRTVVQRYQFARLRRGALPVDFSNFLVGTRCYDFFTVILEQK